MALIESISIQIGQTMPDFSLEDPSGITHSIDSIMGEHGLLVAFTCNHCPYAIAVWPRLIELSNLAESMGISTVAINPNINPAYPDDSPENMALKTEEWNIPFPYLVDETQTVAKHYNAQCTPDIYLLKKDKTLFYHGRIDDNWKDASKVRKEELKEALQHLSVDAVPPEVQYPTLGCSIKWR